MFENQYKKNMNNNIVNNNRNLRQDFVEQNYKVNNKPKEIDNKKELPKPDNSFLNKNVTIGVSHNGNFIKR